MAWYLTCTPPLPGAENMGLDAALLARARRTGDSVVRVYRWASPTLSLGRNQRAAGEYDAGRLAAAGVDVVRRPTGGRALLHHREITYSVTAPALDSLGDSYRRINALLRHALAALGVTAAEAAPAQRALPPTALPCFAEPAAGELVAGGRKLVGSAQWRDDGALLQHGSILVDDDQGLIAGLMRGQGAGLDVPPPATLRALLGRAPSADEAAQCLLGAVQALEDPLAAMLSLEPAVLDEGRALAARYRDDAWTWRR